MNAQEIYSELRSAIALPKNAASWARIVALARRGAADEALAAQLEEEVWPAVLGELGRAWPASLRVVSPLDPPLVRALGKTLRLEISEALTRQLGQTLGLKLAVPLNKKTIRQLAPRWLEGPRWEGLILRRVEREHEALIAGLIDAGLVGLRQLHILDTLAPHEGGLRAMVERAIDAWGPTLESYRVTQAAGVYDRFLDHAYGPLVRRAAELPALRELWAPAHGGADDPLVKMLGMPAFDALEALILPAPPDAARVAALRERPASANLRRVRIGASRDDASVAALMAAPEMAGVQSWDVRASGLREDDGWESPEAALWAAQRAGLLSEAATLDAAHVDLTRLDAAQTREALFEGERLRPSPRLETLRLKELDDASHLKLAQQASEAWPALRGLHVECSMGEEAIFEAWSASPLAPRLRAFEWGGYGGWIFKLFDGVDDRGARRALLRSMTARSVEVAAPALARCVFDALLGAAWDKPEYTVIAKGIGVTDLEGTSRDLIARCRVAFDVLRPLAAAEER